MNLDEALAGLRALNMQFPEMEQDAQRRKQNEAMRLRAAQTGAFGGQFDPMAGTQGMGVGANVADRAAAKAAYGQQIAGMIPQAARGDVWGVGGRKYPPIPNATPGDYPMVRKDDFTKKAMNSLGLADRQKEMIASGKWDPGQTGYGSTVTVKDPNAPGTYPRDQKAMIRVQGGREIDPDERDAYANTLVDRGLRTQNKRAARLLGIDVGDMGSMSRGELIGQKAMLQRKDREATVARQDQRRQSAAQNQMLSSIPPNERARYLATLMGNAADRENAAADRTSREKIAKMNADSAENVAGVKGQPTSREDAILGISIKRGIPMSQAAQEYDAAMKAPGAGGVLSTPGVSGVKTDVAGFKRALQNDPSIAKDPTRVRALMEQFGVAGTDLRTMSAAAQPGAIEQAMGNPYVQAGSVFSPLAMVAMLTKAASDFLPSISPEAAERQRQEKQLRALLGTAAGTYGL